MVKRLLLLATGTPDSSVCLLAFNVAKVSMQEHINVPIILMEASSGASVEYNGRFSAFQTTAEKIS